MKRCCQSYCRRVGTTPSKGCVIVVLVNPLETCDDHDLTVIKLPADPLGIDLFKSCIAVIACRVHGYLECIQGNGTYTQCIHRHGHQRHRHLFPDGKQHVHLSLGWIWINFFCFGNQLVRVFSHGR